jgi:hypothetical protein
MGALLYFVAFRKNDFEQRVVRYIPYHAISVQRKQYLGKVEKYKRYICNGLAIFFALVFIIPLGYLIALDILKGWMLMQVASWALSPLIFLFWGYYLLSSVVKRNAKAQHLLLEEMSDKDFEYLLKVQKNLSWLRKYFPFFILCKDKLYFFTFFTIREIDPKRVEKMRSRSSKGDNRTVLIKHPKWFMTSITGRVYPHLQNIIKKYNPQADIKS